MRFVVLNESNVVVNVVESDEAFGAYMGWIRSDTATYGDVWDGTSFTTPPPPPATLAEYSGVLDGFLSMQEQTRRNALRDEILAAANPPMTTLQEFVTALENRVWD